MAVHFGTARTHALLTLYFYWPWLSKAVEDYVRTCDVCARNKPVRHAPYGLLSPLPIPEQP